MSRATLILAVATACFGGTTVSDLSAQNTTGIPAERQVKKLPRQSLSGPRFGFTTFTGETADLRSKADLEPIMSQFGWQFETQIVSQTSGNQALMEWLLLVGGVEEENTSASLAWLAGYRLPSGVELGVGPNLSLNLHDQSTTSSMVVAAGVTAPFGDIYVPFNVAVAFAKGGPRFTTLIGWIIG
jgi:hypothetical protein